MQGDAVSAAMEMFEVPLKDLVVVHYDPYLEFGKYDQQMSGRTEYVSEK